jgi:hypothetical protein
VKTLLAVLLLALPFSAVALGPKEPPPGWCGTTAEWEFHWSRSEIAARDAHLKQPGSSYLCLQATFLRMVGQSQAKWSRQCASHPSHGLATVRSGKGYEFAKALDDHQYDQCRPPNGGEPVSNLNALASYLRDHHDWEESTSADAAKDLLFRFAQAESAKPGRDVRAIVGAGAALRAPAESPLPVPGILLVTPHPCDVDRTLPVCGHANDGT